MAFQMIPPRVSSSPPPLDNFPTGSSSENDEDEFGDFAANNDLHNFDITGLSDKLPPTPQPSPAKIKTFGKNIHENICPNISNNYIIDTDDNEFGNYDSCKFTDESRVANHVNENFCGHESENYNDIMHCNGNQSGHSVILNEINDGQLEGEVDSIEICHEIFYHSNTYLGETITSKSSFSRVNKEDVDSICISPSKNTINASQVVDAQTDSELPDCLIPNSDIGGELERKVTNLPECEIDIEVVDIFNEMIQSGNIFPDSCLEESKKSDEKRIDDSTEANIEISGVYLNSDDNDINDLHENGTGQTCQHNSDVIYKFTDTVEEIWDEFQENEIEEKTVNPDLHIKCNALQEDNLSSVFDVSEKDCEFADFATFSNCQEYQSASLEESVKLPKLCPDNENGIIGDTQFGVHHPDDDFGDFGIADDNFGDYGDFNSVVMMTDENKTSNCNDFPGDEEVFGDFSEADNQQLIKYDAQDYFIHSRHGNIAEENSLYKKVDALVMRWIPGTDCQESTFGSSQIISSSLAQVTRGDAFVWRHLEGVESSAALLVSWNTSLAHHKFLSALKVDPKNLVSKEAMVTLFGSKWSSSVPLYAQTLTFSPLTPAKSNVSDENVQKRQCDPINIVKCDSTLIQNEPESIPPVSFDWTSSGLTNPLDSAGVENEILGESSSKIPVRVEPSAMVQQILNVASLRSDTTRVNPQVKQMLQQLPNLAFMKSPVLTIPTASEQL